MIETQNTATLEKQIDIPSVPIAPNIGKNGTSNVIPISTVAPNIADKKTAAMEKQNATKPPKGRPEKAPDADKPKKSTRAPRLPKGPKSEKQMSGGGGISGGHSEAAIAIPKPPPQPRDATRLGGAESIVYIAPAELFPFKAHPFRVRDDEAIKALVESVKERGIDQPALVRPRDGGGFELVAGRRRQHAVEFAGYINVSCVVRNMTDDEAILAMTESNFNQRTEILPSERAKALKMQLDAIKHQGAKSGELKPGEVGKRSNEIIAERNKMSIKNVQRYIALNNLVPELMQLVDDKTMKFTVAVELSYIKPKNQDYIAVAIEAQQSAPSGTQALVQPAVVYYPLYFSAAGVPWAPRRRCPPSRPHAVHPFPNSIF